MCKLCVVLGNKCHNGASVRMSQKLYLNNSANKSLTTRPMHCYLNVPSVACLPLLMSSLQSALSMPRFFSSHSGGGDDATDSDAAANYYQLYERLVTQSQPSRTPLPLSSDNSSSQTGSSRTTNSTLSHVGDSGMVKMVDVGSKSATSRVAVAAGRVKLGGTAFQLVAENRLKKGNVLTTAQLAGIMAAKQTSQLIPLCHNIVLTSVDVTLTLDSASLSVIIECTARSCGQTGVEMEALTGVSVAALTVYDMCKSVSHDIVISDIKLLSKTGGKSNFRRQ